MLDKNKLEGLNDKQAKFEVFKNFFMNTSEVSFDTTFEEIDEYKWLKKLEPKGLYSAAVKGSLFKVANCELREASDEAYEVINSHYQKLLEQMKRLSLELGMKNSLELSNLYSYLLWNGYLSKTKQNIYSIENRKLIFGLYFADIMDGVGVCLNHADMLKDFLNSCDYTASSLINLVDKQTKFDYKMSTERKVKKSEFGTKIKNILLEPIIKKIGNHAFTLIKDNNKFCIYDSTNLALLEIKDSNTAEVVNGRGTYKLSPYFSVLFSGGTEKEIDAISGLFETDDFCSPYTRKEFVITSENNVELFNNNVSLLDDFYTDVRSDIVGISEATDKIKAGKKVRIKEKENKNKLFFLR